MDENTFEKDDNFAVAGTPRDYTESLYRFYFEVGEYNNLARTVIADFLGPEKAKHIVKLTYGYEFDLPIQCVPEVARKLLQQNIAIYQIVRFAKVNGCWQSKGQ
ncbi:MAG: hypothetical protein ACKO21_08475 [Nodosilinea sp.]|jgi:hypothetical protein